MLRIRKADQRGKTTLEWLKARHTFSFGGFHDPAYTRFRRLRVLNDDIIAPGGGFPNHPHEDMEIITYVISGALEHKDSTGGGGVIRPGDVQHMSAGSGVFHSEFNHSKTEPVRLLQIWVMPTEKGVEPVYQQQHFAESERSGVLRRVATPGGRDGSMAIHADAAVYTTVLGKGQAVQHEVAPARGVWIQVATGDVDVNGDHIAEGDGVAIEDETAIEIVGVAQRSEVVLLDLA